MERELQAARSGILHIQDRDLHAASGQLRGPSVAMGAAQKTAPNLLGVRKRQQPAKALDDAASVLDHRTTVHVHSVVSITQRQLPQSANRRDRSRHRRNATMVMSKGS